MQLFGKQEGPFSEQVWREGSCHDVEAPGRRDEVALAAALAVGRLVLIHAAVFIADGLRQHKPAAAALL